MCTALVGEVVSAAVVGSTQIEFRGRDVAEPKEVKSGIDLLDIGVRLDKRAQARNSRIPRLQHISMNEINELQAETYTMEIVRQDSHKVYTRLQRFRIDVLQILVLCGQYNSKTV